MGKIVGLQVKKQKSKAEKPEKVETPSESEEKPE